MKQIKQTQYGFNISALKPLSWIGISLLLFLVGCQDGNINLDNASLKSLSVKIDETEYDAPAGSLQRISVEKGNHTIVISDSTGKVIEEGTFDVEKAGLLNVGKTAHLIWKDLYGEQAFRDSQLEEKDLEVQEQIFFGDFTLIDSTVIYTEKEWDYDVDEDFPYSQMKLLLSPQKKYIVRQKMFRFSDFVAEYIKRATEGQEQAE